MAGKLQVIRLKSNPRPRGKRGAARKARATKRSAVKRMKRNPAEEEVIIETGGEDLSVRAVTSSGQVSWYDGDKFQPCEDDAALYSREEAEQVMGDIEPPKDWVVVDAIPLL